MKARRTAVSALWLFLLSSLAGRNRFLRVSFWPKRHGNHRRTFF